MENYWATKIAEKDAEIAELKRTHVRNYWLFMGAIFLLGCAYKYWW